MSLVDLQLALSSKANYVGSLRVSSALCWKTSDREHVLVADQLDDPFVDPIVLEMIGQVGRGGGKLNPHGSYKPNYDNFNKAKITFELEMPKDAVFAADYLRGVAFLKRLVRNARPAVEERNLLVDSSAHSNVRFGAPLFRAKRDDDDEEEMPEDYISPNPADASYFPTSANWPMGADYVEAFESTRVNHVFCPIHVVDVNDLYVNPASLAARLPGSLVRVYFTLRYWNFKEKQYNSFSANIVQVQILRTPQANSGSVGKRLVARASSRLAAATQAAGKRPASPQSAVTTKKQRVGDTEVGEAHTNGGQVESAVIPDTGSSPDVIVHVAIGTQPAGGASGIDEALGALDAALNIEGDAPAAAESSTKAGKARRGASRV
ncbi:hypothetical protein BDN71DRAFT_1430863 [Pleurotus eryngii]|uniref:Uncharacterized protein n=1 Tax=Pleurotus eryngii TaxID=5323 RepID=A0A9P6A1N4_PLEER|nr:hypothetical protein BDN71DRAFT_1430863 [Pleurotus eryngii]